METISFASAFALCVILTYSAFIGKYNAVFQQCGYRIGEYVACFKSSLIRETRKVVRFFFRDACDRSDVDYFGGQSCVFRISLYAFCKV